MSDLSNDTKKHTTKSRETIPLKVCSILKRITRTQRDGSNYGKKRASTREVRGMDTVFILETMTYEEELRTVAEWKK
jgi:hypothetical protein